MQLVRKRADSALRAAARASGATAPGILPARAQAGRLVGGLSLDARGVHTVLTQAEVAASCGEVVDLAAIDVVAGRMEDRWQLRQEGGMWHKAWALSVVWPRELGAKHSAPWDMMADVMCAHMGRWDEEISGMLHRPWGHE